MLYETAVMGTSLGEWLEREFDRRGWDTLFKASKNLDLPVQTIHDLLKKPNKTPSPATLRKLSDGLAVSLERLFELIGQGTSRGGVPEGTRALPESVQGLSEESYEYLSRMTPDQLERWIRLLEERDQSDR